MISISYRIHDLYSVDMKTSSCGVGLRVYAIVIVVLLWGKPRFFI